MTNKMRKRIIRICAVLIVLMLIGIAWMSFRVREIGIYGNTIHTAEEIQAGLTEGPMGNNTLYLAWKYRKGEIPDALPYLNEINVQLDTPSRLTVEVSEKEPVGYIEEDEFIYFDSEGTVLEMAKNKPFLCTEVTGVAIDEPVLYQKLPSQSSAQLRTVLSLIQLMKDHNLDCGRISLNENSDITVYIDKIEAQLGQDEYLEEKVANLNKIMEKLEGKQGVLHLENFTGKNETVSFSPANGEEDYSSLEGDDLQIETEKPVEDELTEDGLDAENMGEGYPEDGNLEGEPGADGTSNVPEVLPDGVTGNTGDPTAPPEEEKEDEESSSVIIPMVFNSSGTLIYNVHVEGGVVVDAYGNVVDGCYVNEAGNVVDAYMNQFDPTTGENIN